VVCVDIKIRVSGGVLDVEGVHSGLPKLCSTVLYTVSDRSNLRFPKIRHKFCDHFIGRSAARG
jgi:hypothetical protein